MVLGHSHSHGGGHGHSHGGGHGHSDGDGHDHSHGDKHGHEGREETVYTDENCAGSLYRSYTPCDVEEGGPAWKKDRKRKRRARKADNRNINVRAAFIHTIGDLIQSLGVLLAAYIIKFRVSANVTKLFFSSLAIATFPLNPCSPNGTLPTPSARSSSPFWS